MALVSATILLSQGEVKYHTDVNLVSVAPTEEQPHFWTAWCSLKDDEDSARFLQELLNDDIECVVMLSDGRTSPFMWAYDGSRLLMQGVAPLARADDAANSP